MQSSAGLIPRDKPETAAAKKAALIDCWSTQNQSGAWHFLTGEAPQIKEVTSAAGFFYKWDDKTQQSAHMSGVLVLTPDGRLSWYFYGVEYSPKELRLALVESGQGTSDRWSTSCCRIAITTTPPAAGTVRL